MKENGGGDKRKKQKKVCGNYATGGHSTFVLLNFYSWE